MGKIEKMNSLTDWERELALIENKSNLRKLPVIRHLGKEVEVNGKVMLNLSSNDYLGLVLPYSIYENRHYLFNVVLLYIMCFCQLFSLHIHGRRIRRHSHHNRSCRNRHPSYGQLQQALRS